MLISDIDYSRLPHHCQDGLREYIEHRRPVGDFLYAVLSNDLKEAFVRADDINIERMFDYVKFLYSQAPSPCWGSPEKVQKWLKGDSNEA